MKKGNRFVVVTIGATWFFTALMIAIGFCAPQFFRWYTNFFGRGDNVYFPVLITYYCCLLPGLIAASRLLRILYNMKKEEVFAASNVRALQVLTGCCAVVFLITFIAGFFYFPFFIFAAAALFISLILCVIRSVFIKATALKDENDLTI